MIELSKEYNPNYIAQVVEIDTINPHPNADRLQIATINFQPVIVGLNTKKGDLGIYLPVESQISADFLHENNMYSSQLMNKDTTVKGYIGKRGRVKATKLRGEYSMGLFIPKDDFLSRLGEDRVLEPGMNFDTTSKGLFVKKYEIVKKEGTQRSKQGQKPQQSRLVDGQVHLHVDTENLRRNMYKLSLDDTISITYKYHGTSATFQNVLVKKKLSFLDRIAKFFGSRSYIAEYDVVYTSRKVVKNKSYETSKLGFYDSDPRAETAERIGHLIPQSYCIYGEIIGFQSTGSSIQGEYDYGMMPGTHEFIAYRMTITNPQGIVFNLSTTEAKNVCDVLGIKFAEVYYTGTVRELLKSYRINQSEHRQENLIIALEERYNGKRCHICNNDVPAEGIVLRKERSDSFEAYKLKCREFLLKETEALDSQAEQGVI